MILTRVMTTTMMIVFDSSGDGDYDDGDDLDNSYNDDCDVEANG